MSPTSRLLPAQVRTVSFFRSSGSWRLGVAAPSLPKAMHADSGSNGGKLSIGNLRAERAASAPKIHLKIDRSPYLRHGGVARNGRDFDMRGMLPHSEARMRMCVMQVGKRGRWTYRDWARWRFLWKFFPWYAREMRYRGDFCL
jgi:hypothetical protein